MSSFFTVTRLATVEAEVFEALATGFLKAGFATLLLSAVPFVPDFIPVVVVVFVPTVLLGVAGSAAVFFTAESVAEGVAFVVDGGVGRAVRGVVATVDRADVVVLVLLVVEVVCPGTTRDVLGTDGAVATLALLGGVTAGRFRVPSVPAPTFFGCTRLLPCGTAWVAVLLLASLDVGSSVWPFIAASVLALLD